MPTELGCSAMPPGQDQENISRKIKSFCEWKIMLGKYTPMGIDKIK